MKDQDYTFSTDYSDNTEKKDKDELDDIIAEVKSFTASSPSSGKTSLKRSKRQQPAPQRNKENVPPVRNPEKPAAPETEGRHEPELSEKNNVAPVDLTASGNEEAAPSAVERSISADPDPVAGQNSTLEEQTGNVELPAGAGLPKEENAAAKEAEKPMSAPDEAEQDTAVEDTAALPEEEQSVPEVKKSRKKRKGSALIVASVILLLLAAVIGFGVKTGLQAKELLAVEDRIEADFDSVMSNISKLNMAKAHEAALTLSADVDEACAIVNTPYWRTLSSLPVVGGDAKGIAELLSVEKDGTEQLLLPALDKLEDLPLKKLRKLNSKKAGTLVETVSEILDLTETLLPTAEGLVDRVAAIPPMQMPSLEDKMTGIREACVVAASVFPVLEDEELDWFREKFAPELCEVLSTYPPNSIDTGEMSFDLRAISAYLTLAENNLPELERFMEKLRNESEQLPANLSAYAETLSAKVDQIGTLYRALEKYLPLAKYYLNSETDRNYMFVAQNSAEVRALGGFPGSVSRVRVKKGILSFGDFKAIYRFLPGNSVPDPYEKAYFGIMVGANRDADVNPHFPTVAKRWVSSYEERKGIKMDGVISITPAIIADIMKIAGEVTLMDGTVLNSENAVRYLENELYIKYLNQDEKANAELTDTIFADAAVQIMKTAMFNLSIDKLIELIPAIEKHAADRVLMLWLADEEGEELIRSLGFDGGFNEDPANPQLGVYFNNYRASKLGWYLDIEPTIEAGTLNSDGTVSYPVSVTLRNTITREETKTAGRYVIMDTSGYMGSRLILTAPAGGSFSNFDTMNPVWLNQGEFGGTQILYSNDFNLGPEEEITFRVTVTTAPGEQNILSYVTTPTLTEYR